MNQQVDTATDDERRSSHSVGNEALDRFSVSFTGGWGDLFPSGKSKTYKITFKNMFQVISSPNLFTSLD